MTVPAEYTNARKRLTDFRNTVLTDLVGGRVKAGLNASHDSMGKYSKVIQQLSVTPKLFGSVNSKALALQLKGLELGDGQLSNVGLRYISNQVSYPLNYPHNVPARNLPQVDVFKYDVASNIEALEGTNIAGLQSLILIQANSGTFLDIADAENSIYDYYQLHPTKKLGGVFEIVDPLHEFVTYKYVHGECYVLFADMLNAVTRQPSNYFVYLWLNPTFMNATGDKKNEPCLVHINSVGTSKRIKLNLAGRGIDFDGTVEGANRPVTQCMVYDPLWGHNIIKAGRDIVYHEDNVDLWRNTFNATVRINNEDLGTTEPEPESVTTLQAESDFIAIATPNDGCVFDYWLRDGIVFTPNSSMLSKMYKSHVFEAHFSKM